MIYKIIRLEDLEYYLNELEKDFITKELNYRIITKDNRTLWFQNITTKIYKDGKYLGLRVENRDITEIKSFHIYILKLSSAIEQSPISIIITDRFGKIEYANKFACELNGYDYKELIGKNTSIFRFEGTPKDYYKTMWETILSGKIWDSEVKNVRKNDDSYWARIIISPVFNEAGEITNFIQFKSDISTEKELEFQLKEYQNKLEKLVEEKTRDLKLSEEKYRILVENSEDGIIRLNKKFELIFANKAFFKIFGFSENQILNQNISSIPLPDNQKELLLKLLNEVLTYKVSKRTELQLINIKWVDILLVPEIEENDRVKSIVGSAREITDIKDYEIKIKNALNKEKETNLIKSRFISTASHEFKTPLTTILSSTQLLERLYDKLDHKTKKELFERIYEEIDKITNNINDLLIISKIEDENYISKLLVINLPEFLFDIVKSFKILLKKGQQLKFINKINNILVETDKKLLEYIVNNLISNAIKYSGEGKELIVFARFIEDKFILSVKDNGVGIPEDELNKIFEPFYRTRYSSNVEGTGLGLSIVKNSVKFLNGNIKVESKLNEGSVFTVEIPMRRVKG